MVQTLLEQGHDANATNGMNLTPLHLAAQNNLLSTVTELIKQGARVDVLDKTGRTPLLIAATYNHREVVEALRHCGAHLKLTCSRTTM